MAFPHSALLNRLYIENHCTIVEPQPSVPTRGISPEAFTTPAAYGAGKSHWTAMRGHRVLHIWGKGRSEADALVKIVPALDEIIGDYLETRGSPAPSDALFASCSKRNRGGRLTTRSVSGIAKKALARIGVDDPRYTAHSLRHTSITLGLLGGATPEEVQAMARHADISTTMIYAHDLRRLEDAAEDKVAAMLAGV